MSFDTSSLENNNEIRLEFKLNDFSKKLKTCVSLLTARYSQQTTQFRQTGRGWLCSRLNRQTERARNLNSSQQSVKPRLNVYVFEK